MVSFSRKEIAPGVFFNTVHDNRFKTMRISVNVFVPLKKQTAAKYAMLSQILTRSCEDYPTVTQLSRKLSSLYGASLYGGAQKLGDIQCLNFTISAMDDRYSIDGESISAEISKLLCSVILKPNFDKNRNFVSNEIEQERRQLLELIDSEFNDKKIYALGKCVSLMCKDEPYGIARYGDKDSIQKVTAEELYEAWEDMLANSKFEIMYTGDSDSAGALKILQGAFCDRKKAPELISQKIIYSAEKISEYEESMDLAQSKLILGFRTGVSESDDDTTAMRLACAILGGTASSKLFNNVREKLSLCYYCGSSYNRLKGIMTIQSGVESCNMQKARAAILNEVEDMKKGNISDFEFDAAVMAICNSFKGLTDTVSGLETWFFSQLLYDNIHTIDEEIERFKKITKQDVIAAMQKVTLDTVYMLTGTGEE